MAVHVDDVIWGRNIELQKYCYYPTTFVEPNEFKKFGHIYFPWNGSRTSRRWYNSHRHRYIRSLGRIPVIPARGKQRRSPLTLKETNALRSSVGQIFYAATTSRPDVCFEVLELSISRISADVSSLVRVNKVVNQLKQYSINFPSLNIDSWR